MKFVAQESPTTCGQACIAMLLDLTLEEAIQLVGHDGITTDDELKAALHISKFIEGAPRSDCIAIQKHKSPYGLNEHWTVSYYGRTLDPAGIPEKLRWKVYKHAEVEVENR